MSERVFRATTAGGVAPAFKAAWTLVNSLYAEGGVELVVRKLKDKRSLAQNRYYWRLLREISAVAWIDGRQFSDQVFHEQFKRWFIGCEEIVLPDGAQELRGLSTTKLSVEDMAAYITQVEQWAVEQGFPIAQEAA